MPIQATIKLHFHKDVPFPSKSYFTSGIASHIGQTEWSPSQFISQTKARMAFLYDHGDILQVPP